MTLTVAIFAGGQSRRMGVDKATLTLDGRTFWAKQLAVARELGPAIVCFSARTRPAWCPAELTVIIDDGPACGPLTGLATVLRQLQTTHLLSLAIDLPRMTSEHLKRLWNLATPGCGVIPRNDCFEPLCAIYPVEAATVASECQSRGDGSLQNLARLLTDRNLLRPVDISPPDRPLYHNANTPAAFAAIANSK